MSGGFVSGSQFGTRAGIRVAIFAALTLGFPFIVYGLILATNARSVGGASGALAAVAGVYLKPIIILAFLISLIGLCWRRMRSLGLPGFCGLLVPFLFLMDATYLLVVGTHWGTAFSLGIMQVSLPAFAMVALTMLVTMSVAMPPSEEVASSQLFCGLLWCCVVLAVLLVVVALMTSSTLFWIKLLTAGFRGGAASPPLVPAKVASYAYMLKPFVCVAYCAVVVAMAVLSRRGSSGNIADGNDSGPMPRPLPPAPMNAAGAAFGKR